MNFVSGGLMGDFIHSLYVVKHLCPAREADIYLVNERDPWRLGIERAYLDCRGVVLAQPYVRSLSIAAAPQPCINLSRWRDGLTLTKYWSQLLTETYGFAPTVGKWLTATAVDPRTRGRAVIHRSLMRHNREFPWPSVLAQIGEAVFVTSSLAEWQQFEHKTERTSLLLTPTISEMANAIASCSVFVGNQSAPFALACALDVPRLVELDAMHACFYVGEKSDTMSWFLNDNVKRFMPNVPIRI